MFVADPVERFLKYVRVDTQSTEGVSITPSTPGQWTLARMLAAELTSLGAVDVGLSEHCHTTATIPATIADAQTVPVIAFLAHVDTSPAVSGANVTPIVHANYQGGDVTLPGDPSQVLRPAQYPVLTSMIGDDLITTDGTTLLGSDDKSGVAAIMAMAETLLHDRSIPHGTIKIAFTSDEEIGSGVNSFDVSGFGATFAYTVDGDSLGEINHETWSARLATITLRGVSAHPGTAKGVMVNTIYAVADIITRLPVEMRPETTDERDGFIHPYSGVLDVETTTIKIILRDFDQSGLNAQEFLLRRLVDEAVAKQPGLSADVAVVDQYRNMNDVLKDHPQLVEHALEAARRAGLTARTRPIRGGTDGSKLTFRGMPCPNIFTGGHNFHSKLEFNSRRGLEKTAETLVHLAQIWAGH